MQLKAVVCFSTAGDGTGLFLDSGLESSLERIGGNSESVDKGRKGCASYDFLSSCKVCDIYS